MWFLKDEATTYYIDIAGWLHSVPNTYYADILRGFLRTRQQHILY